MKQFVLRSNLYLLTALGIGTAQAACNLSWPLLRDQRRPDLLFR
jgi:hypothetical protein